MNITQTVNSVMALEPGERISRNLLRTLDHFIFELRTLEENPEVLGSVTLNTPGPFPAQSFQTLELNFQVGTQGIAVGGKIVVPRHFFSDSGVWQVKRPKADHYLSASASNREVELIPDSVTMSGMHGGFRGAAPQTAFRIEKVPLLSGDTVTLRLGDRSGGSRGYRIQSYSNDAAPIPLYVDLKGDGRLLTLPIRTYSVIGKSARAIHGFAPSIVGVDEPFSLNVRAEDEFRNRASGQIPGIQIFLNGKPYRILDKTEQALQIIPDLRIQRPGIHRFTFTAQNGKLKGICNPIWVEENPGDRIFWGETHGHCGFAEGQGTAEGFFRFGRDDARLDFLTLSEHDIWMDDAEWKQLNALSEQFTQQGRFIAFPGYEWTTRRSRGGHHNVIFRTAGRKRVPSQEAPTLSKLYRGLHATLPPEDVLVIPHAHQAADWRLSDPGTERLVEIMSMHGTFEWFGQKYLEQGFEVGFIGASDDHLGHPGYSSGLRGGLRQHGGLAAVFAESLTTDGVFDGLRNRTAYATSGPRILLKATLNGYSMGTRQPFRKSRTLEGRVSGESPIDLVELIKNGEVIRQKKFLTTSVKDRVFAEISFHSESDVFFGRDNPRGNRPWNGRLNVVQADLEGLTTDGIQNRRSDFARRDPDIRHKIHFRVATRGRKQGFMVELSGVTLQTQIRLSLEKGREFGAAPPRIRPSANIPAAEIVFRFQDLVDGEVTQSFRVGRHRDQVQLRIIQPKGSLDQSFSFEDNESPEPGDWYYLKILQLDGGLAWSSPFWVGGESIR
ncbi:MAG TPA: DUF3604 domain-containing protein [Verrucomicrobiales bacterium]|nr:DUF3604 domain-containing protein [Verrucomicrobiales bacterium]